MPAYVAAKKSDPHSDRSRRSASAPCPPNRSTGPRSASPACFALECSCAPPCALLPPCGDSSQSRGGTDRRQSLLLSRFATARVVLNVVLELFRGEARSGRGESPYSVRVGFGRTGTELSLVCPFTVMLLAWLIPWRRDASTRHLQQNWQVRSLLHAFGCVLWLCSVSFPLHTTFVEFDSSPVSCSWSWSEA